MYNCVLDIIDIQARFVKMPYQTFTNCIRIRLLVRNEERRREKKIAPWRPLALVSVPTPYNTSGVLGKLDAGDRSGSESKQKLVNELITAPTPPGLEGNLKPPSAVSAPDSLQLWK